MNAALCVGACLCFFAGFPIPALVLRCGLSACMRFSPRAALGLSGLAALFACAFSLCVRVVKGERFAFSPMLPAAAFWGGAFGRACVLIMDASLRSSLSLLRLQSPALAALMLFAMLIRPRKTDAVPRAAVCIAFALAALDGFLGSDTTLLLTSLTRTGIARRRAPSASLLSCLCAQLGAILMTHFTGAALIFPARMYVFMLTGAALGVMFGKMAKEREKFPPALPILANIYGLIAALACVGHAFFRR